MIIQAIPNEINQTLLLQNLRPVPALTLLRCQAVHWSSLRTSWACCTSESYGTFGVGGRACGDGRVFASQRTQSTERQHQSSMSDFSTRLLDYRQAAGT